VPIKDNPFAIFNASTGVYHGRGDPRLRELPLLEGPRDHLGDYTDVMPSVAIKYTLRDNLFLKLGYNKAIKRPDLNRTAGPWVIDLDPDVADFTITIPNPT